MGRKVIGIVGCAAAGLAVALGGASSARTTQNTNSSTAMGQGNMNRGGMMMVSSSDRKFMMMAAAGGMAEVAMAQIALERASGEGVKQYAQRMIDDHTKANEELMGIAQAKGVALPAGPDAKHMAAMEKMRRLSGAEFDRQYIMMAGHKDHEKMEKLYRDEAAKGRDADVKAFAAKTLPVVREHLAMARAMHGQMMGGMKSGGNMNSGMNMNSNMNSNMNMNGNSNRTRGNTNNSNR